MKKLVLLVLLALAFLGGSLVYLSMARLAFTLSTDLGIFTSGIALLAEVLHFVILLAIYCEFVRHWRNWPEGGDA